MLTTADKCLILGKNVKEAMEKENLTVEKLSDLTGLSLDLINSLLSGNEEICEKINSDNIIKLASALNTSEFNLLSLSE